MSGEFGISVHSERWQTRVPFRITGYEFDFFETVVVEIFDGETVGRGEGLPVFYLGETTDGMLSQLQEIAGLARAGIVLDAMFERMPPGGARNALNSAILDFDSKREGRSIWDRVGIDPAPLRTCFTIGLEATPEAMALKAEAATDYPILKIKVDSDRPVEKVRAIRTVRPDAVLTVDANQGWTLDGLKSAVAALADLDVQLIEQPLPRGQDDRLTHFDSPIPLCADESFQHAGELEDVALRYSIINIKLDKIGGLTPALKAAQEAKDRGLKVLVGNMGGTSLSMAPAFVLGQLCEFVELDGPSLLKHDRPFGMRIRNGVIGGIDQRLWG